MIDSPTPAVAHHRGGDVELFRRLLRHYGWLLAACTSLCIGSLAFLHQHQTELRREASQRLLEQLWHAERNRHPSSAPVRFADLSGSFLASGDYIELLLVDAEGQIAAQAGQPHHGLRPLPAEPPQHWQANGLHYQQLALETQPPWRLIGISTAQHTTWLVYTAVAAGMILICSLALALLTWQLERDYRLPLELLQRRMRAWLNAAPATEARLAPDLGQPPPWLAPSAQSFSDLFHRWQQDREDREQQLQDTTAELYESLEALEIHVIELEEARKAAEHSATASRLALEQLQAHLKQTRPHTNTPAAPPSGSVSHPVIVSTVPPLRVILADDNPSNARLLTILLTEGGHHCVVARNGLEAERAFMTEAPDLILMDVQMPVCDGVAATRAIRQYEQDTGLARTPIIAVTANADTQERLRVMAAGMDDVVSKPLSRESVDEVLRRWHSAKQPDRSNPLPPPEAREHSISPEQNPLPEQPLGLEQRSRSGQASLPVFHLGESLARCRDNGDLARELHQGFLAEIPAILQQLHPLLSETTADESLITLATAHYDLIHRTCGGVAYTGFVALAEITRAAETAARQGHLSRQQLADWLAALTQAQQFGEETDADSLFEPTTHAKRASLTAVPT